MSEGTTRWDRFWFGFEASADRVAVFRVVFFAVLAIDLWIRTVPAAFYGMAGFNVSHLAFLDSVVPLPTAAAVAGLTLFGAYLAWRMALGGGRRALVALAVVWWVLFLWSQLDSWRHHYLVAVLLVILATVQWRAPKPRGWPVRLILVQLSIVYLWTAVAKLDPAWFDGRILMEIASDNLARWVSGLAVAFDAAPETLWRLMAAAVIVMELILVAALQFRRLWPLALAVGVPLHLLFHLSGLDIGRFSFVVFGLYMLLLPEAWLAALAGLGRRLRADLSRLDPRPSWLGLAAAALLLLIPLPGMVWAAALVLGFGAWSLWRSPDTRLRGAVTHTIACVALLACHVTSDVAREHYIERAVVAQGLGDVEDAAAALRQAAAIDPDYVQTWVTLGELEAKLGDAAACTAAFEQARALVPTEGEVTQMHADALEVAGADARQIAALRARACEQGHLASCPADESAPPAALMKQPTPNGGANPCRGRAAECHQLGLQFLTGRGVPRKNDAEAARNFEAACALDHAPSCRELGALALAAADFERAAERYEQACEARDAAACTALGGLHATGRGVAGNDRRAATLYRWACDNGDAAGCANLGFLHTEGRGVTRDPVAAQALYKKACAAGDAFGCRRLRAAPTQ